MTIKTKTRTTTTERTVISETTCDMCGRTVGWDAATSHGSGWSRESYSHDRIEIRRETGNNFPEGGSETVVTCEVCPECWDTKVTSALLALGAVFRTEERDW